MRHPVYVYNYIIFTYLCNLTYFLLQYISQINKEKEERREETKGEGRKGEGRGEGRGEREREREGGRENNIYYKLGDFALLINKLLSCITFIMEV